MQVRRLPLLVWNANHENGVGAEADTLAEKENHISHVGSASRQPYLDGILLLHAKTDSVTLTLINAYR